MPFIIGNRYYRLIFVFKYRYRFQKNDISRSLMRTCRTILKISFQHLLLVYSKISRLLQYGNNLIASLSSLKTRAYYVSCEI